MRQVFVRIPKRISRRWMAKHAKDGLDDSKISVFLKFAYGENLYSPEPDELLLFIMNFQKKGGQPMRAKLWVRRRTLNSISELVLVRAHAEPI